MNNVYTISFGEYFFKSNISFLKIFIKYFGNWSKISVSNN